MTMLSLLIFFSLLLSGLFSGAEIAFISADRIRLRHLERAGSRSAKSAMAFLAKPEGFLSTILVGTNLANVATTVLATSVLLPQFGQTGKVLLPFLITLVIFLFGEILPKALFRKWAETSTLILTKPLLVFYYLFYPLIFIVKIATKGIFAALSLRPPESPPDADLVTKSSLEIALKEGVVGGIVNPRESKTISSIFAFSQKQARDIMIKKEKIFALPIDSFRQEFLKEIYRTGHERVPLFQSASGGLDEIVGILHVTDLFKDEEIRKILHPPQFVSETMNFNELLTILREEVNHLVLVRNEEGKVVGLITLDDILKELFGEIREEFL
ncbi:HlyC/CorC family transporter [candidate division TA06 bacterium]|nr:HlyC/CorC family transporter [candidate division TA06 bacterium]